MQWHLVHKSMASQESVCFGQTHSGDHCDGAAVSEREEPTKEDYFTWIKQIAHQLSRKSGRRVHSLVQVDVNWFKYKISGSDIWHELKLIETNGMERIQEQMKSWTPYRPDQTQEGDDSRNQ